MPNWAKDSLSYHKHDLRPYLYLPQELENAKTHDILWNYLNDKYGFDAPSANGYVGILWTIGGLHDRAFIDYPVTGKIRRMTYNSIKRKYNLSNYITSQILE